uniref:EF-hand domain-containing protein n=1 Tax=Alexandrium monilatum TaxID=311494 RepID=A0A7S4QSS6_9DINO|mmetsp:Transcript_92608/g.293692  ORF Transcript_92608/g.293692 Transcript_92608/m.293692 type:complete len:610 (+) Transcript_92608:48-1877(+)
MQLVRLELRAASRVLQRARSCRRWPAAPPVGGDRRPGHWAWRSGRTAPTAGWRSLFGGRVEPPTPAWLQEHLAEHPSVECSALVDGVAYVVRRAGAELQDWDLEEYMRVRSGLPRAAVPTVRFVDHLPARDGRVPFTQVHMLDALFRELDPDGTGSVSLQEFVSFCRKRNLFSSTEVESQEVFLNARSSPTTSELIFGGNDFFRTGEFDRNKISFYEFQKIVLDAGLVEVAEPPQGYHTPLVSYFVDDRIVDIVVRRWFAMYDIGSDGCMEFDEYAKLVTDFRLPMAVSHEAFRRLTRSCMGPGREAGLGPADFQVLLEEAGVLQTGASVEKDDEVGQTWRRIEDSQRFLPPTRVFVADGRVGTSPPQGDRSLRFVCVSDTHGHHRDMTSRLPPGDVLLHAGDFSMAGELDEVTDFGSWLQSLPYAWKVVIAGNHDLSFDRSYSGHHSKERTSHEEVRAAFTKVCGEGSGIVYLEDGQCRIEGIGIYGSPWQPEFNYWAFNLPRGHALAEKWRAVPTGVDVLLVHGPPLGRGDACLPALRHLGCADLLHEVQSRIRPAFCVYGHVHEGAGVTFDGTTHFVNACSLNEHYECIHAPLVFDLPIPNRACES